MSRIILTPKLLGETRAYGFTFTLPVGVTISSASVAATVYSGTDASPSSIISGSASASGAIVTQNVTAGTAGVIYDLVCTAILSDGQTLQLGAYLAVLPNAP